MIEQNNSTNRLFNLLFISLSFVLPLLVFPTAYAFSASFKLLILSTVVAVSLIIFLLGVLHSGNIEFPKTKITSALLLFTLLYVASSFFSGNISSSFFGTAFEIGTSGSMVMLATLFLVSIVLGIRQNVVVKSIMAFIVGMGLVLIHALIVTLMSYGALPTSTSFPLYLVGSYYDLSILLSAGVLFSLCLLNLGNVGNKIKYFLWAFNIVSIIFIGAIGSKTVEIALGVFSLSLFVYLISVSRQYGESWMKKSYSSIFVLLISFVFIISGTTFSDLLSDTLKINSLDVRPNMSTTLGIAEKQLSHNPVTGIGANRFVQLWSMYKPLEINTSNFWGTDFIFGYSFVSTSLATSGILGILSLILFLFLFIKKGLQSLFPGETNENKLLVVSTFIVSLFMWSSLFFYNPGVTSLAFMFMWTGLFIASLSNIGSIGTVKINIFSNPKTNFIAVFFVVVAMMGVASLEYFTWEKMIASAIFNRAITTYSADGDIAKGETSILKAINMHNTDLYDRSIAGLELINIEKVVSSIPQNATNISDSVKNELQGHIANAISFAKAAIAYDGKQYQNYIALGSIYESLATRKIAGAQENAISSYVEAEKLNPGNPGIQLAFSRLYSMAGDMNKAKDYANKAIALKPNYTDAFYFLAQLEAASNNLPGTIKAVEGATLIDPTNPGLYFQLGLLKYQSNDINGAIQAFERSIIIVPDYANAKYFLGLAYDMAGKKDLAIQMFKDLAKSNSDNAEVKLILANLEAGKPPFVGAKSPIDNKPASRKTPPLEEKK